MNYALAVKVNKDIKIAELEEKFINIKNILESLGQVEYTKNPYIIILITTKYDKIKIDHNLFNDSFIIGFVNCDIKLNNIKYEELLNKFFVAENGVNQYFDELTSLKNRKYTEYFNEVTLGLGRVGHRRLDVADNYIEWIHPNCNHFKFTLNKVTLKWDIHMFPVYEMLNIDQQNIIDKGVKYYINMLINTQDEYDGYKG
jgi:hypothetical protein